MHLRGYLRLPIGARRLTLTASATITLALSALPALTGAAPGAWAVAAQAMTASCPAAPALSMASQDQLRTGWDNCEDTSLIGPAAVPKFVQRWKTFIGGQVYAQPLVLGSTVVAATENDRVYGLDRTTGRIRWQRLLGHPFVIHKAPSPSLRKCGDLTPSIGVTGTPAVDPATGNVYMFAKIMVGKQPRYFLFGIDPANGRVVKKVPIGGHPSNAPKATFNAQFEQERPGVLISGGAVYGAWAGHCDVRPYDGYVARVALSTRKGTNPVSLWSDESGLTRNRAGIWDSGSGLITDPASPAGGIYVTSGNGVSPAPGPGTKPPGQLAESVINLRVNAKGAMYPHDFFSPSAAPAWDAADTDFGSGGPVGLPVGTQTYPHILVQAGKSGQIFLLNRDSLGGRDQGPRHTDQALFVSKAYGGQWGHPAVFESGGTISAATDSTANNYLFYVGKQDSLRAFRITAGAGDKPVASMVGNSSLIYPYTSGSPVVTSSGSDPATAVVWVVRTRDKTGTGGELDAYSLGSLINSSGSPSVCTSSKPCLLKPIWHSPGTFFASKFTIPATAAGWVYVGTRNKTARGAQAANGYVIGYSLPAAAAPVKPATTTVTPAAVGSASTSPVSVTVTRAITVTGASTSGGATNAQSSGNAYRLSHVFLQKGTGAGQPVKFPVTLLRGDKLIAWVQFTPVAPGSNNGTLTFRTSAPGFPAVQVPLTGDGIRTGVAPQEPSVAFQLAPDQGVFTVPVGIRLPQTVDFTNYGTTPQQVTSVTPPAGEFTATGLPSVGETINPGETIAVQVTFAPTHAGPASSAITIATGNGSPATVQLTGAAIPAVSRLTPDRRTVGFGTVRAGKRATAYVHITNTGNQPSAITTTVPASRPFAARLTPPVLMPLNPGYDMVIPVTFTPTRKGSFRSRYTLHWTDGTGSHSLTVTLTGKAV